MLWAHCNLWPKLQIKRLLDSLTVLRLLLVWMLGMVSVAFLFHTINITMTRFYLFNNAAIAGIVFHTCVHRSLFILIPSAELVTKVYQSWSTRYIRADQCVMSIYTHCCIIPTLMTLWYLLYLLWHHIIKIKVFFCLFGFLNHEF